MDLNRIDLFLLSDSRCFPNSTSSDLGPLSESGVKEIRSVVLLAKLSLDGASALTERLGKGHLADRLSGVPALPRDLCHKLSALLRRDDTNGLAVSKSGVLEAVDVGYIGGLTRELYTVPLHKEAVLR